MATQTTVVYWDDLAAAAGREVEAEGTHTFALDGAEYEIDLSAANVAKLGKALAPFVEAGRPVKAARATANGQRRGAWPSATVKANRKRQNDAVRAFADERGIAYSTRGRLPATLVAQWREAGEPGL